MHDTKKGKYSDDENEEIIHSINQGLKEGKKERDILKELSNTLNRGYAGIMSHVRKLRSEFPDRFYSSDDYDVKSARLNSWDPKEEDLVIETVNRFLEKGRSLSSAISELEHKLSRTQGAIYQRIYTLRRKHPDKFNQLPAGRPRKPKKLPDWQSHQQTMIQPLNEHSFHSNRTHESGSSTPEQHLQSVSKHLISSNPSSDSQTRNDRLNQEEQMVYKAFEERYGRPNMEMKKKLLQLMHTYGCTRVSIALFTLSEDKMFPNVIVRFLEQHLQRHKYL